MKALKSLIKTHVISVTGPSDMVIFYFCVCQVIFIWGFLIEQHILLLWGQGQSYLIFSGFPFLFETEFQIQICFVDVVVVVIVIVVVDVDVDAVVVVVDDDDVVVAATGLRLAVPLTILMFFIQNLSWVRYVDKRTLNRQNSNLNKFDKVIRDSNLKNLKKLN